MSRYVFFTALFVALLSSAAFAQTPYIITGNTQASTLTVTKDGTEIWNGSNNIQDALNSIKANANGEAVYIQFQDNDEELSITSSAQFTNSGGGVLWGDITLSGKITRGGGFNVSNYANNNVIDIQNGVSVTINADIRAYYSNNSASNIIITAVQNSGTVTINGGSVSAAGSNGNGIVNYIAISNSGTLTISGSASVSSSNDTYGSTNGSTTISNNGGTVHILGGTVSNTDLGNFGRAVHNASNNSTVNISGGTVKATTGIAVYNAYNGVVNISGGTVQATTSTAVYNASNNSTVNISGGTVKATTGIAVYNDVSALTGTVNISGGTVQTTEECTMQQAIDGCNAVRNFYGTITVSGNAAVSSAIPENTLSGTILNTAEGTINIFGGTVSNTASNGYAVYLRPSVNSSYGSLVLGGSPTISGNISGAVGRQRVITEGENTFNPGTETYMLSLSGTNSTNYMYSIAVVDGADYVDNFTHINSDWGLVAYGDNIVVGRPGCFDYTKNGTTYTITQGVAFYCYISQVINLIREDANGEDVSIKFGDGTEALNFWSAIVYSTAIFANDENSTWGEITLLGKMTSAAATSDYGTVKIQNGVSVTINADIANTASGGRAIYNDGGTVSINGGTISAISIGIYNAAGTGTVSISGGTVEAGSAIQNYSTGTITVSGNAEVTSANVGTGTIYNFAGGTVKILGGTVTNTASNGNAVYLREASGSLVLGGSPTISGNIKGFTGRQSVDNTFAPGQKTYAFALDHTFSNGDVAVAGAASFIDNFTLTSAGWSLDIDGDDLVLKIQAPYIITRSGSSGNTFTVTLDGNTVGTANLPSITDVIEAIKTHAGSGNDVSIQFGDNVNVLSLGGSNFPVDFNNTENYTWGKIALSGKMQGTINIQTDASVESVADITGGCGITIAGTGAVSISGGTVQNNCGMAAINNVSTSTITVSDDAIITTGTGLSNGTIRNSAGGTIEILGGTVGNSGISNPGSGTIIISGGTVTGSISNSGTGTVNIFDGTVTDGNLSNAGTGISNSGSGTVNIFDGTVQTSYNTAVSNAGTGTVNIFDGTVFGNVSNAGTGTMSISGGTVQSSNGSAVYNASSGTIIVSGVTVVKANAISFNNAAIHNRAGGTIEILGGTVSIEGNSSLGVLNSSTGTVSISGGTIQNTIQNSSTGTVNISGGTVNRILNSDNTSGVIVGQVGTINISGGAVGSVNNMDNGTVNISGGTVGTTDGSYAISNENGTITVSGDATVTSANTATAGTIYNLTGAVRIFGGTVENTASSGTAVYIGASNSSLVLGGSPVISGNIVGLTGTISVKIDDENAFNPGAKNYTVGIRGASKPGGKIAVANGAAFADNFAYSNVDNAYELALAVSGNNLVLVEDNTLQTPYIITYNGSSYLATRYGYTVGSNASVQTVINAIRTDAIGDDIFIQFGDGESQLNIASVSFSNAAGSTWGNITFLGKINSTSTTAASVLTIQEGVSVESSADIASGSGSIPAITNNGTVSISGGTVRSVLNNGTVNINGGTVSGVTNNGTFSISNGIVGSIGNNSGTVSISGGAVNGSISNTGTGTVNISGGTVSTNMGRILNQGTGKITVSGDAVVTSATSEYYNNGTIFNYSSGTIEILGGKVINTAEDARSNAICLSGGSLILGGSPEITGGNIKLPSTIKMSVNADFAPGAKTYALTFSRSVDAGTVLIQGGAEFINNFMLVDGEYIVGNSVIIASGNDLVVTSRYTVTFVDWNGEVLETQTVEHGSAATAPEAPAREGYTFTGWNVAFNNVTTGNLTVTALYAINAYTVTFKDYNGTELKTQTVNHGSAATAPANPVREGHTFTGWDVAFNNVTGNLTVTALYDGIIPTYTVTFVDYNGTVLKTETVNSGASATAPADPVREGHIFTGWDVEFDNVTGNLTVTALYDGIIPSYTVTFVDWNGEVLETQTVEHGSAATAPESPVREGHTFTGWDVEFNNVTDNLTVTALYDGIIPTYTVTFVDWDGEVLETQTVNSGASATAPANPVREGYTFTGWDVAFNNVTGNLTVTAEYEEIEVPIINSIASSGFGIVLNGLSFRIVGTTQATSVVIYNLHGKMLMSHTAMPNESVSVSHLPKGVYVVKAGGKMVKLVR